jgi:hypothetical protein
MISAKIDGELTPDEEAELRHHLAECPDCRRVLEAYEAIDDCAPDEAEAPEALSKGVMYKINLDSGKGKKRRFFFGRGTVAAAAVIAVMLGVYYFNGGEIFGVSSDSTSSVSMDSINETQEAAAESAADMEQAESAVISADGEADVEYSTSIEAAQYSGLDDFISQALSDGDYYAAAVFTEIPDGLSDVEFTDTEIYSTAEITQQQLDEVMDKADRVVFAQTCHTDAVLVIYIK